jgi:hypothetical protein
VFPGRGGACAALRAPSPDAPPRLDAPLLRDDTRSIAERNEDVNRRRREAEQRAASAGGKLTARLPIGIPETRVAHARPHAPDAASPRHLGNTNLICAD